MKKMLTIAAIAAIGFAGCKKSSSGTSYTMSAKAGSTSLSFTNVYATLTSNILAITANNGTSTTTAAPYISIVLDNYTTAKTYTIDTTLAVPVVDITYAPDLTMTDWKLSHTGSVTITSFTSTEVDGSFTVTCTDGTVISSSTFKAKRIN